jgi:hypothetical protein
MYYGIILSLVTLTAAAGCATSIAKDHDLLLRETQRCPEDVCGMLQKVSVKTYKPVYKESLINSDECNWLR